MTTLPAARNILLCLRYGIGDLVMEMPVLDALRRRCPQARITALGARPAIQLLEGDRRADRLVCVQDWGLRHWGDGGSPRIDREIRAWLAAEAFDLVLDPGHAVLAVREAIRGIGPVVRDSGGESPFPARASGGGGQAAIRAAVQAGWGIEVPAETVPRICLGTAEREFAEAFLRTRRLGPGPVGFSPVASSPLKRWGVEHFAGLADHFAAETRSRALLFTGPQGKIGRTVRDGMRRPAEAVVVGSRHLRRVAALLAACRLFIGNDTGLMHMAAAVGTPVIALFGPTSPDLYLPDQVPAVALGGRDGCPWRLTAVFGPPACVTGGRCLAGRRSCIDDIEPVQVLTAARNLLESTVICDQ